MTLGEAISQFLLADPTLAAKVSEVYPESAPQQPPDCYASYRFLPGGSGKTLAGATDLQRMRIEITVWGKVFGDLERLVGRIHEIMSPINGPLGSGGPFVAVSQTVGPRTVQAIIPRYYGMQIDVIAQVDVSTQS